MLILQKKSLRYISISIFHFSVYPPFPAQTWKVVPPKPEFEIYHWQISRNYKGCSNIKPGSDWLIATQNGKVSAQCFSSLSLSAGIKSMSPETLWLVLTTKPQVCNKFVLVCRKICIWKVICCKLELFYWVLGMGQRYVKGWSSPQLYYHDSQTVQEGSQVTPEGSHR